MEASSLHRSQTPCCFLNHVASPRYILQLDTFSLLPVGAMNIDLEDAGDTGDVSTGEYSCDGGPAECMAHKWMACLIDHFGDAQRRILKAIVVRRRIGITCYIFKQKE